MIAVFGASGFLGRYIYDYFSDRYDGVQGTYCSTPGESLVRYDLLHPGKSPLNLAEGKTRYAVICSGCTRIDEIKNDPFF